jgi:hypothetical protein
MIHATAKHFGHEFIMPLFHPVGTNLYDGLDSAGDAIAHCEYMPVLVYLVMLTE